MSQPERTCVGCRARGAASGMVRVVAQPPGVAVDLRHTLPGRGAWVHAQRSCVETATRRKAWARALKVTGLVVDADELCRLVGSGDSVF